MSRKKKTHLWYGADLFPDDDLVSTWCGMIRLSHKIRATTFIEDVTCKRCLKSWRSAEK